jgi:hypothetical protein
MTTDVPDNPFAFDYYPRLSRSAEPHRGALILTLGIMSLATAGMVSPVACFMGWGRAYAVCVESPWIT